MVSVLALGDAKADIAEAIIDDLVGKGATWIEFTGVRSFPDGNGRAADGRRAQIRLIFEWLRAYGWPWMKSGRTWHHISGRHDERI
ncbi:MAG: hypothetical protein ACRDRJ_31810 [Streptosporangiaceae bacterium]